MISLTQIKEMVGGLKEKYFGKPPEERKESIRLEGDLETPKSRGYVPVSGLELGISDKCGLELVEFGITLTGKRQVAALVPEGYELSGLPKEIEYVIRV